MAIARKTRDTRHTTHDTGDKELGVNIGKLKLKNPVILASGTAGFGKEIEDLIDIDELGAIVTKTITLKKREGNKPPRVSETPSGMLNSIGLENSGMKDFIFNKVPYLKNFKTNVIASISGNTLNEFKTLAKELSKVPYIHAIEINLSCPNVIHGKTKHAIIAQDKNAVEKIVKEIRRITGITLIAKLSPHVTDIKEIARSAEKSGADAISLINTYPGMLVDISTMKPKLGNVTGGLSGPAIKPLALKCVWDVYNAVKIPVIGMGGIMTAEDAIEFILCGASAVQVGTANFVNPKAGAEILKGIKKYLSEQKVKSISRLVGKLRVGVTRGAK